jgi:hypothetical protein
MARVAASMGAGAFDKLLEFAALSFVRWTGRSLATLASNPRLQMRKSLVNKREQMVGEAVRHTVDMEHWNRINPDEEPLQFPLDFTDDVESRRNAPGEDQKAG